MGFSLTGDFFLTVGTSILAFLVNLAPQCPLPWYPPSPQSLSEVRKAIKEDRIYAYWAWGGSISPMCSHLLGNYLSTW